jgi:hypothetical protein
MRYAGHIACAEDVYKILVRKTKRKESCGIHRHSWEDSIAVFSGISYARFIKKLPKIWVNCLFVTKLTHLKCRFTFHTFLFLSHTCTKQCVAAVCKWMLICKVLCMSSTINDY